MFEFLIDNKFVIFGGRVFQQTVGIPMGTNCAPLLADLFLYSYEVDFIQGLLKKNEKKLARSFNIKFRYIDDVLSLNNSGFGDFVDRIYPIELEIKDTTHTDTSASYLDLHLEIDSEGRLTTKLYDKRDDFNFPIVNFSFICSNIPAAPAYGVYISQSIQYSRACGSYQDFLDRGLLLTKKLLNQGFPGAADPGFQVRGGGAHLKKLRRAEGGANMFGVFRVKNHDSTPKNHIISNCGGGRENFWSISCEKSRFYANKSYFFSNFNGERAPGAPPPGSAPGFLIIKLKSSIRKFYSRHHDLVDR